MKATKFFVRRPVLFWSLMGAILIAGLLSFIRMPKLEDLAVAVMQAMVMVPYPGASAHEVELQVAQMMENELRALPNVKKVKSECRNGSAMLTVEFQMTVLDRDLEQLFNLLRRKVNDAASRLPEGCYDPVVIDDMMDVYGIFYGLTADDVEEIRNLEIRTMDGRQLRIGNVARVERGYAAPKRNGFFVDGRPALGYA